MSNARRRSSNSRNNRGNNNAHPGQHPADLSRGLSLRLVNHRFRNNRLNLGCNLANPEFPVDQGRGLSLSPANLE